MKLLPSHDKKSKDFFPREGMVGDRGSRGSGRHRPNPARARCGCRRLGASGRRSLTERPPTRRPAPVQCTGWLLWQSYTVPAMGGWCGSCTGPRASGLRSRAAADLYAFGQWSAAWSRLARSSRSVGPYGQRDGWTILSGGSCLCAGWCSAEHGWPLPIVLGE